MAASVAIPPITDVMKALSDPIRWKIVIMMAATDELACTTLEQTLPVAKSTISYHIKTLVHAHLIHVRKEGRYYFYTLRRDVLRAVLTNISVDLAVEEIFENLSLASRRSKRKAAASGSLSGCVRTLPTYHWCQGTLPNRSWQRV